MRDRLSISEYLNSIKLYILSYLSVIEGPLNHVPHGLRSVFACVGQWCWTWTESIFAFYLCDDSQSRVKALGSVPLCSHSFSVMLRPTVLCLLLACAVSLSSSAVVIDNGMPILWAQTVGQVTDLPIQNGILTPDGWHFLHRMSLYRLIIAATDPFMGSMGTNATDSPLWGLPLQLGWMITSGKMKIMIMIWVL